MWAWSHAALLTAGAESQGVGLVTCDLLTVGAEAQAARRAFGPQPGRGGLYLCSQLQLHPALFGTALPVHRKRTLQGLYSCCNANCASLTRVMVTLSPHTKRKLEELFANANEAVCK